MGTKDTDSFAGSIGDTNSETLTVSTAEAESVVLTIDDGTVDNTPSTYDLVVRTFSPGSALGRFQFYLDEAGRTDRSWQFAAVGSKMELEVTNQSGGSATYEMTAESRGE